MRLNACSIIPNFHLLFRSTNEKIMSSRIPSPAASPPPHPDADVSAICHNSQHSNHLLAYLHGYQKSGRYCDVVLEVEQQCLHAHSCVLAACSPLLADTINDNTKHVVFSNMEVTLASLETMLEYMYTGKIFLSIHNVHSFLEVSQILGLAYVTEMCKGFIKSNNEILELESIKENDLSLHEQNNDKSEQSTICESNDEILHEGLESNENTFDADSKILDGIDDHHDIATNQSVPMISSLDSETTVITAQHDALYIKTDVINHSSKPATKSSFKEDMNIQDKMQRNSQTSQNFLEENVSNVGSDDVNKMADLAPPSELDMYQKAQEAFDVHEPTAGCEEIQQNTFPQEQEKKQNLNVSSDSFDKQESETKTGLRRSARGRRILLMNECYISFDEIERKLRKNSVKNPSKHELSVENHQQNISQVKHRQKEGSKKYSNINQTMDLPSHNADLIKNQSSLQVLDSEPLSKIHEENSVSKRLVEEESDNSKSVEFQNLSCTKADFQCKFCKHNFEDSLALKSHVSELHSGAYPYICLICHARFKNLRLFNKHNKENHNETEEQIVCSKCGKTFPKSKIQRHSSHCHESSEPESKCPLCEKTFKKKSMMLAHKQTHSSEKPFSCDICNAVFSHKNSVDVHKASVHFGKKHPCKVCGKEYKQLSSLSVHMREHNGKQKQLICVKCGKVFSRNYFLKKHMETHYDESTLFQCSLCQQIFLKKEQLSNHLRTHKTGKPFICEVCGATFSHKYSAKIHMRTHTGAPASFSCHICEKTFSRKSYLRNHLQTHTGDRPYECTQCGKRFTTKGSHKAHMDIHEGRHRFQCAVCQKRFHKISGLKSHLKYRHKMNPEDSGEMKKVTLEIEDVQIIDEANIEYIYEDMVADTDVLTDI